MKVAVVTGSAKGLGREIALALAKDGYTLVLHYLKSKKEAISVLALVKKRAPKSILLCADLKKEKEVARMFAQIYKKFPNIDLLVNNVGNYLYKNFKDTTNGEFVDILESNVYSTLFCSREVLVYMRRAKSGHIINIGAVGVGASVVREKSTPYFIAKNAVFSLTKIMAWEEARNGIHVNMISPASLVEDIFEKEQFPMGRSAKFKDVIDALLFLTREQAYYINGASIEVAGAFIPGLAQGK